MTLPIGEWALNQAVSDHREWREAGVNAPRIALNIAPLQLRQRNFVSVLERGLGRGAVPAGIDLEIAESLAVEDVGHTVQQLGEIRALGMRIAIDGFGTGASSLASLSRLPVHTLKIDRSFIVTMLDDPHAMTLISTIISLAHGLRLGVVAVGVEAEEQAKMLRLLRCDEMQGMLFSPPVPKEELLRLLRQET